MISSLRNVRRWKRAETQGKQSWTKKKWKKYKKTGRWVRWNHCFIIIITIISRGKDHDPHLVAVDWP